MKETKEGILNYDLDPNAAMVESCAHTLAYRISQGSIYQCTKCSVVWAMFGRNKGVQKCSVAGCTHYAVRVQRFTNLCSSDLAEHEKRLGSMQVEIRNANSA